MRKMVNGLGLICLGWLVVGITPTRADLTTYPDFPTYSAAVSGLTSVVIPDPAPDFYTYLGTGTASVTYSGVTFSQDGSLGNGNFFNVGSLFSGSPAVLSSQEQTVGVANILITLPNAVTAFSLNYGTFAGSDVTFTLSNGDTITQGDSASGYQALDFFGATDTTAFTSVLVTTIDPGLNINNITFGPFSPSSAVPGPASIVLVGMAGAFGSAATAVRRKWARA